MLTGQIGLCTNGGFFGRLIQKVTKSKFNHVIIAITENYCISAEPGGVVVRKVSEFPGVVWSHFPMSARQARAVVLYAGAQVGKEYAFFADFLIGIALLTRSKTPQWIERRLSSNDSWQCAELGDAALLHSGIHVFDDGRPVGAVYPGSFVPVFQDFGWL